MGKIDFALVCSNCSFFLKLSFFREGAITQTSAGSGYSDASSDGFYYDIYGVEQFRCRNGEDETVYNFDKVKVIWRRRVLYTFRNEGALSSFNPPENINDYHRAWTKVRTASYNNAYIFADRLIAWDYGYEDIRTYEIKKINRQDEDYHLTKILETIVSDGYLVFFDDIGKYMIKYDGDFIKPYIIRYASGDFTQKELKQIKDVKPEYVQEISSKLLEKLA